VPMRGRTVYNPRKLRRRSLSPPHPELNTTFYCFVLMSSTQPADSPQVRLFHELARGLEKKDTGPLAKHITKDFCRVTYPQSLGKPDQTAEEWLRGIEENIDLWTGDSEVSCSTLNSSPLGLAEPDSRR
jgi:hypothetical protein